MKTLPTTRPIVRPLMTVRDVMKRMSVSANTVNKWMRTGTVSYLKIGKSIRFEPEVIDDLIENYRKGPRLSSHVAV